MRVHVLFFGHLKEIVGRAEEDTELSDDACPENLFARYGERYPELAGFRGSVVVAVNQGLAGWESRLSDGDEVAFLPPVSGGASSSGSSGSSGSPGSSGVSGAELRWGLVQLVREPIRVSEIVARLRKAPEDGAITVFEGVVRNHSAGRRTLYLEYQAYEPMALAALREIAESMHGRFQIDHVALVHRLGHLVIGETSVLVGVAAAHRAAAFDACRFGIDTLKRTAPIWKKEYLEGGAVWAEGQLLSLPSNSGPQESMT